MDDRFRHHWARWNELRATGQTPADFLPQISDETLVELLAYAQEGTPVERNIIATELTNRISRLHRSVGDHSDRMDELVDENKTHLDNAHRADDEIRLKTATFRSSTERTSRYAPKGKREGGW